MSATPSHRPTLTLPWGRPQVIGECFPKGRSKRRGYCKYCYSTHREWWHMRRDDYGGEDVLLCGRCEHTTLSEFV